MVAKTWCGNPSPSKAQDLPPRLAVGRARDPGRRTLYREGRRLLLRDGRVGGAHPDSNPDSNPNSNLDPDPNSNPNPNPNPHPHLSPHPNQVLTHSLPFTGMNPVQIGLAVREQKLRPPLPDDCPAGFGALLRDCWHDEPEQRHAFAVVLGRLQAIEMLREFDGLAELPT